MKTIERYLTNAGFSKLSDAIYEAENDCEMIITVDIEKCTFRISHENDAAESTFSTPDNLESFLIANGFVNEDINNINPIYA